MKNVWTIARRELSSYFATPIAAIFLSIFLILAGAFTFGLSNFYGGRQADLQSFFVWHPFLYAFLIPALSMRLWAEERRSGTVELLMTLPISPGQAVLGKFLAAWLFAGLALALTFPIWLTVNYLGDPDNGAIVAGYVGSWLMAGAFLGLGSLASVLSKNQVVAFVLSAALCILFLLFGHPGLIGFLKGWAPQALVDLVASFGFLTHFEGLSKGVIEVPALIFFASLTAVCLWISRMLIERLQAS
jgi:ABC-2 type transport system permease protein